MEIAKDKELPVEYLRECFHYDPETGELTWKERPLSHFEHSTKADGGFNKKYAGKIAGSVMARGYVWITLNKRPHFAHRIAWAIHYGEYPKDVIDHVNGIRLTIESLILCNPRLAPIPETRRRDPLILLGTWEFVAEAITENIEALFRKVGRECGLVVSTP
jgi:hypothetical protein